MTSSSSSTNAQERRPQETDWRLFLRLGQYAKRSQRVLFISILLLIPLAFSGAIQPILIGQTISLVRQEPTYGFLQQMSLSQGLNVLALLLLLTIMVRLALQSLQGYLIQKVGQQITADIRDDLFHHVTSLSMGFFDRTPVGRLITRLTSDVNALGDVFSTGAVGIIGDIFSIVVIAITMFTIESKMATLLILAILPTAALIVYFQQQYRVANYRARDELSNLNSQLQENLVGIGIVQLFRREQFNAELFRTKNQNYIDEIDKTIFYDSAVSATLEWIALVAIALVLWLGGKQLIAETISFGTLSTFILFAQRLFDPLRQFAEKFTALQAGFTAVERISNILNEPIEIQDPNQDQQQKFNYHQSQVGEIKFDRVSFAYKANEYVLKDLDFTIRPGEKVALVGPTGAGK